MNKDVATAPVREMLSPSLSLVRADVTHPGVEARLTRFLRAWLGAWPPTGELEVVVWSGRDTPGWDGDTWPGLGVESPHGTVLSLSPRLGLDPASVDVEAVSAALRSPEPTTALGAALARPELRAYRSTFRWSGQPAPLPDIGEWLPHDAARPGQPASVPTPVRDRPAPSRPPARGRTGCAA
jgi:hypothetical protein